MAEIKDSGDRREFESGAVRDMAEGKGRCDLLPLREVNAVIGGYSHPVELYLLETIDDFLATGYMTCLFSAIDVVILNYFNDSPETAMLEVAVHYEEGAKKYAENNWRKGIPVKVFIDSAIRHYLKLCRGDMDERHDRALLWNLLGALWTLRNKPELATDLRVVGGADDNETHGSGM